MITQAESPEPPPDEARRSRPAVEVLGSLIERKTFENGSTSLAGSPLARASPATCPAATAASRSATPNLTQASCASRSCRGAGARRPRSRRHRRRARRARGRAGSKWRGSSVRLVDEQHSERLLSRWRDLERQSPVADHHERRRRVAVRARSGFRDRKSTRLNSSHPSISYAVFCLKKKK